MMATDIDFSSVYNCDLSSVYNCAFELTQLISTKATESTEFFTRKNGA
ncbi:14533_t:CDS:2 [Racocetra fulgida]|uniref:14533_t:CDS:1 n=1 Tax=Racocetra fulgida TaxID=60492 RepID=A0A9N8WGV0_9GLOM|nr:14533_t:CDS:2 [Racocetra fulgida]